MRVVITADAVGGVGDHAVSLARHLAEDGCSVLLLVLGPRPLDASALPAGLPVEWRECRLEWMPGGLEEVAAAGRWIEAHAVAFAADVVHLNQLAYAPFVTSAPTVVVVHSDVYSWWSETLGSTPPPAWNAYGRAVSAGLAAAHRVVSPTAYQAALVARHYRRYPDRVVHNGSDAPPVSEAAASQPRTGVLTAGRAWDPAKGMRVLDLALVRLAEEEGHAPHAVMHGDTEGPAGERFEPVRLLAAGRLPREALLERMRSSRLYVAASRYEPFGLAPLEAALSGCPLLLSDIGSFRELWKGAATFFPAGDPEALAAALRAAADDVPLLERRAAVALERARARFGAERMLRDYIGIYSELIPRGGRRRTRETRCS
jgi:glycogen synthase